MKITFLTGNPGKVQEMEATLQPLGIEVVQDDRGYPEIQHDALSGVTEAAAGYLMATGVEPPFMLEDAGLFVSALGGFPGVYSRHALETIGNQGILALMRDIEHETRRASFVADLCYVDADGNPHHFEGACHGSIAERASGEGGFGFDPIFIPDDQDAAGGLLTFAEMGTSQKNQISHRGRAANAFLEHLGKTAKT